jgi:hypothetical protein
MTYYLPCTIVTNQAWRVLVDGSEEYAHCRLCLYEEQYCVEMTEREREERWAELYDSDASDQEISRNWLLNMTHLFWRYLMTFLHLWIAG